MVVPVIDTNEVNEIQKKQNTLQLKNNNINSISKQTENSDSKRSLETDRPII